MVERQWERMRHCVGRNAKAALRQQLLEEYSNLKNAAYAAWQAAKDAVATAEQNVKRQEEKAAKAFGRMMVAAQEFARFCSVDGEGRSGYTWRWEPRDWDPAQATKWDDPGHTVFSTLRRDGRTYGLAVRDLNVALLEKVAQWQVNYIFNYNLIYVLYQYSQCREYYLMIGESKNDYTHTTYLYRFDEDPGRGEADVQTRVPNRESQSYLQPHGVDGIGAPCSLLRPGIPPK